MRITTLLAALLFLCDVGAEVIPVKYPGGKLCLIDTNTGKLVTAFSVCYPADRWSRR